MGRGGKNVLAAESGWQWSAQGFVARGSRGERQESEGVVGWAIGPAGGGPPAEAVAITPTGKGDTRGAIDEGKHQGRVVVRGGPGAEVASWAAAAAVESGGGGSADSRCSSAVKRILGSLACEGLQLLPNDLHLLYSLDLDLFARNRRWI